MANKVRRRDVLRVQDAEGRGPFSPGFSRYWIDDERVGEEPPPIQVEFGWGVARRAPKGWSVGCGFTSLGQLRKYFTATELDRLREFGYRVVRIPNARIIAESRWQCVFSVPQMLSTFFDQEAADAGE